jgi:hypothetical protein
VSYLSLFALANSQRPRTNLGFAFGFRLSQRPTAKGQEPILVLLLVFALAKGQQPKAKSRSWFTDYFVFLGNFALSDA